MRPLAKLKVISLLLLLLVVVSVRAQAVKQTTNRSLGEYTDALKSYNEALLIFRNAKIESLREAIKKLLQ